MWLVRFLAGLLGGWLLVGGVLLLMAPLGLALEPGGAAGVLRGWAAAGWDYVATNLQGSALPFLAVMAVYIVQFRRLLARLAGDDPQAEAVVRGDQNLDLCATLFFGIGVIWTAIGMRDALLHALGDGGAVAAEGAFAVLQRLVDGGILLALSTTIVGGVGGYLMRAVKAVVLGEQLALVYLSESRRLERANLAVLHRIEARLSRADDGVPAP